LSVIIEDEIVEENDSTIAFAEVENSKSLMNASIFSFSIEYFLEVAIRDKRNRSNAETSLGTVIRL
jgi:hypothetical protein